MTNVVPTYLSILNSHIRDQYITFEEGPHIYTVKGERGTYTSVTTWIHKHFAVFNADSVIDRILSSKKWTNDPAYIYFNMSREQIKQKWDDKRDSAAKSGTKMHYDIECFYNNMEVNNISTEFSYFKKFVEDYTDLKPYRTEWMVYYEELKISGSIDMLFENPDGTIQIYDWKRCGEIQYEHIYNQTSITECISHLPDTNFWHYALQLNMYKRILEDKYGKVVTGLYLVCLHPDNVYKQYDRIEVPVLDKEMDALFELRQLEININK
jgi:hypothetical protein